MVRVKGDAGEQNTVYTKLNGATATQARYELVTVEGAVLKVRTGMSDSEVAQLLAGLPVELGAMPATPAVAVGGAGAPVPAGLWAVSGSVPR